MRHQVLREGEPMKLKDLETAQANGMWLAYVSYGNDGMASDYAEKVKVIDARAKRQVSGSRSWHTHSAPGVTIELESGNQRTVDQRKLVGSWLDYVMLRQERKDARAKREQHQAMSRESAEAMAEKLKAHFTAQGKKIAFDAIAVEGVGGYPGPRGWRTPYAYSVRVAPELLGWLLDDQS